MSDQDSKKIGIEQDRTKLIEALFKNYYNPLCNFVYRRVGNLTDAEDIVQEIFCSLWLNYNLDLTASSIVNWLFVATKNKTIDFLRKKKLNNSLLLNFSSDLLEIEEFEMDIMKERIIESLDLLPDKCKKVFRMAKMEGLSYIEIAHKEDISIKTVEGHITKAFKIIRNALKP
jgi:RNA polymerase sigma-70 factor (family 1)